MSTPLSQPQLEQQLRDSYGLLLTISQLAELLGRTPAGLRWTLANPSDARTLALKDCLRRVGGRAYISATDVAAILANEHC
jgi:hypothetical protein